MATVQSRSDFCFFILCTVLSISYLNPVSCTTIENITLSSSIEPQTMSIIDSEMTMETSSSMSTEQTSMYTTTDESSYFSAITSTATEEIVSSEFNVLSSIDSTPSSANTVTMSGSMTSYFSEISRAFVSTAMTAIINGTQTLDTEMFSSTHTVVSTINPNQSSVDEMSETIGTSINISPTSSESATMSAILDGTESQTIGMFSSHTVVSASDVSQSFVGEMTNTIAASTDISIYPSEQGSTSSNYGQISHTAMTSNSLDITGQITSMQVSLTDSNKERSSVMMKVSTSALISSIPTSVAIATSTEIIIMSSTTVDILPTSSFSQGSDVVTTSSVVPTTTTTTTTTQQPTTALPDKIVSVIGTNSVFKIKTDIILITCGSITSSELLRNYILELLKDIEKVRDVIVIYNPCNGSGRKKRSEQFARTETVIGALNANSTVADAIIDAFNKTGNMSISDHENFKSDVERQVSDVCNSNVCDKYVGYNCIKINSTHANCDSQCFDEKCSGHGECKTIISGANQFGKQCICYSEEYYKYEGEQCETKTMKWELAVAIAGGSGGAIILILIFILILCCCCKSKENRYEYREDSYEPMSEVLGRSGPAHYRNEGIKTHQSGVVNIGYDLDDQYSEISDPRQQQPTNGQSWNPDNSKDTYAKISQQLDQGNSYQIKRPHVSGTRQSESGELTTGF